MAKVHLITALVATTILSSPAYASADEQTGSVAASPQSSADGAPFASIPDIVVTAQKRSESINAVPMSITALGGAELTQRGIANVADLAKVVPGLTFAPSLNNTPVYSLRGIGFNDSGFGSAPAVAVYIDESPLPFPVMTEAAALDLERIEVLKGPQGTLYGQNSTGGAINYIAAKPTPIFEAGGQVSVERFGKTSVEGFVSGPISSTLQARVALRTVQGGAWQYSLTRPGDKRGEQNQLAGRLLLDWTPTERLTLRFSANAWRNRSDTTATQLVQIVPDNPGPVSPEVAASPIAPNNPRAADWDSSWPKAMNDRYWQVGLRGEYELSNQLKLISITSYQHQDLDRFQDYDGTAFVDFTGRAFGRIKTFSQELRLSLDTDRFRGLIGANYDYANVDDRHQYRIFDASASTPFPDLPPISAAISQALQKTRTYAVFANAEYEVVDGLSIKGGIRYTKQNRSAYQCSYDGSVENATGRIFTRLQEIFAAFGLKNTPVEVVDQNQCYSLTPAPELLPAGNQSSLNEDNISLLAGMSYKAPSGALLYATFSRGYKAGAFSNISASSTSQYVPARQERVDAYEAGAKLPLFDKHLQFNLAGFYYDYRDKQERARIEDLVFGLLELLVNVPKVRSVGAEASLVARPYPGLSLSAAATYIKTKVVSDFTTFNGAGDFGNFRGSRVPFTPTWQGSADAQYEWNAGSFKAFVGSSLNFQSASNSTFTLPDNPETLYRLRGRALLDLRAGVAGHDDSWRLTLFGRNVTNKLYETSVNFANDTIARRVGTPATYGISLTVRTR
ncbi:TonB-denpendent receptor [Sphingobium indicum IP26]|uniref:TonB-dependent receptor n=1 Tax=Sphingobium indicum F2 TaxID=1450518 RepID=A0A8E0WPL2_9SPHN|nr:MULTISPECIES: TonB-dependent receptor [Sphingobium]EPR15237.1 TonB-denpendent receptor [Sphingobium indicum IP26]EQB03027.1 TonB-denpendent receptor [Sphingobium sp. HDIP04]KER34905.1 TonB-dependent receptor [Sphingobium indicum F2]KER35508.1 TonB-dependent receptor [Sphingobium indicum F2]